MAYSEQYKKTVCKHYHNSPHTVRQSADLFGINRDTINEWQKVYKPEKQPHQPYLSKATFHKHIKILFLDIETLPTIGVFYSRQNPWVSPKQIIQHGMIASFQYAYNDGAVINMNAWDMGLVPDKGMLQPKHVQSLVKFMRDIVDDADIVVGHNGKRFDIAKLYGFLVKHDFAPMRQPDIYDTLTAARRIGKFEANSLDDLAHYFGITRKLAGGMSYDRGIQALCGDEATWREIIDYGDNDVHMLRELYLKIRPHSIGNLHPNMNHYFADLKTRCVVCGSTNIKYLPDYKRTPVQAYNMARCDTCGHLMQERTTAVSKEKKEAFLKSC